MLLIDGSHQMGGDGVWGGGEECGGWGGGGGMVGRELMGGGKEKRGGSVCFVLGVMTVDSGPRMVRVRARCYSDSLCVSLSDALRVRVSSV